MNEISDEVLDRFVNACHDVANRGLVRCSCGNLSMRVDEERFLITATGSWMSRLTRDQVAVCRTADGTIVNGIKPSSEIGFHLGIMRARPEVNVVLHFQTPCATALACRPMNSIDYFMIPEIPYYIGPVAHVPYFTPGSEELAQAVTQAMHEHDMAQMTNHGQVTAAKDFDQAIQNAEFFELACEIILVGGGSTHAMAPHAAETLRMMRTKASRRAV